MKTQKQYLTTNEIASLYGVHYRTVWGWALKGKIRAKRIGRFWYFPREDHEPTTVKTIINPTFKGKNAFELSKEIIEASKKGTYGK